MFWVTTSESAERTELTSEDNLINYLHLLINGQIEFLICECSEEIMGVTYVQASQQDENQMYFEFQDITNPDYEWVNWGKCCSRDKCLSYFIDYYKGIFKPMYDGWEEIKPY